MRSVRPTKRRIQEARESAGYTRARLAAAVFASESAIGQLERGDRRGSLSLRARIAQELGLHPDEITRPIADDAQVPA